MPERRLHGLFDYYLWQKRVIKDVRLGDEVHSWLDKGALKFGRAHQYLDSVHSEDGIMSWLDGLVPTVSEPQLTDYLRIALGHIALDEAKYAFPDAGDDGLVAVAYKLFRRRGWHRRHHEDPARRSA